MKTIKNVDKKTLSKYFTLWKKIKEADNIGIKTFAFSDNLFSIEDIYKKSGSKVLYIKGINDKKEVIINGILYTNSDGISLMFLGDVKQKDEYKSIFCNLESLSWIKAQDLYYLIGKPERVDKDEITAFENIHLLANFFDKSLKEAIFV